VLGRIALGFVVSMAGMTALIISTQTRGRARLTLFAFGGFAVLYGVRILITSSPVQELLGVPQLRLTYAIAWMNYFLPVFGLLYAEQVRGRGWGSALRRFWQAGLIVAPSAIAYDLYVGSPSGAQTFMRIFVILGMATLIPHVIWWRQRDPVESAVRTVGTAVLIVAVLHDNFIQFLPWRTPIEVYGVTGFILSLGFVTARSVLRDQRELAAVEHELETARTIQTSILPRTLPSMNGARIAVSYLPASAVAGDVYDFLPIDDRHVGVLVADVTGHGVSAALIASMATVAFAGQREHAADPGRALSNINRILCGHFDARFITAAYAFVDLERGAIGYSLAGHPPPLLRKATGQLLDLSEGATVLGLFDDTVYPTAHVAIGSGDRLILYTDGLTDVSNRRGEWFGEHAFKSFCGDHGGLPAAEFARALTDAARTWSERGTAAPFDDDVTVVVVDIV
jgi:sigma-B regulation protein RsbU (phosphoserine phosphatase)